METPLPRTSSVLTVLSPASDSASDNKDDNSQATLIADEPSVIRHEVVVSNVKAKNNVSEGQRVLSEEFFHQMAKQAEACFQQDLKNRCYTFRMPFVGSIRCDFQGVAGKTTEQIKSGDIVSFKWTYHSGKLSDVVVAGSFESCNNARQLLNPNCIPRTPRLMLDAVCIAKIYDRVTSKPSLFYFIKKYCKKGGLDVDGCKVIRIVHPKLLMVLPKIEEFADSCGNPSKWFICASVEKNIAICHPGPVSRYTTTRCVYKQSELREIDLGEKEECTAKTFKRRKRKFVAKEKKRSFPRSLEEINEGRHRGFRDVFARGIALAEFGAAKREAREVSVDKALAGFLVDPFEWGNDRIASNNLFVLWTSPDGQHHINGATLRSLMIMIM